MSVKSNIYVKSVFFLDFNLALVLQISPEEYVSEQMYP